MKRYLLDVGVLFALGTVVMAFLLGSVPGIRGYTLTGYVFFVGALLMVPIVSSFSDVVPRRRRSVLDEALAERVAPDRGPAEFERLVREVTMASSSSYDLHHRLLPTLREIARTRLERTGRRPGPDTLGDWWELLRPDREPPEERFDPGIPPARLRALVDDLQRM